MIKPYQSKFYLRMSRIPLQFLRLGAEDLVDIIGKRHDI